MPQDRLESRKSGFFDRWNVGKRRRAHARRDGERAKPSRLHIWQQRRRGAQEHIGVSRHRITERGPRSLVGYVRHLNPAQAAQELRRNVGDAALP